MSDALSDSARDQQRTEASREMWQAFGAFAEAPSAERKQAVLEAAKAVDSINGGYWGGRTSLASKTAHRIEGIERGEVPRNLILICLRRLATGYAPCLCPAPFLSGALSPDERDQAEGVADGPVMLLL